MKMNADDPRPPWWQAKSETYFAEGRWLNEYDHATLHPHNKSLAIVSVICFILGRESTVFIISTVGPSQTVTIIIALHISLVQNLTIKSLDGGKGGHFCNCGYTSIYLPLNRGTQPSGQLSP